MIYMNLVIYLFILKNCTLKQEKMLILTPHIIRLPITKSLYGIIWCKTMVPRKFCQYPNAELVPVLWTVRFLETFICKTSTIPDIQMMFLGSKSINLGLGTP